MKEAVRRAGLAKPASSHSLRHTIERLSRFRISIVTLFRYNQKPPDAEMLVEEVFREEARRR